MRDPDIVADVRWAVRRQSTDFTTSLGVAVCPHVPEVGMCNDLHRSLIVHKGNTRFIHMPNLEEALRTILGPIISR